MSGGRVATATASEAYYAKFGRYPDTINELLSTGFLTDAGGALDADGVTIHGSAEPTKPAWSITYVANVTTYSLSTTADC